MRCPRSLLQALSITSLALGALAVSSCGGGQGGPGPGGAGQGLVMVTFAQDGTDNVALNSILEVVFSEPVMASSITPASLQLRAGTQFGRAVKGVFRVDGASVFFEPALPGLCDLTDAGLEAGTRYRLQLVGWPEEFSIKNSRGQPLRSTITREFSTRAEDDPERFLDQIPAFSPYVDAANSTPANGGQAVTVDSTNRVVLRISENIDPCTVNDTTVLFHMYQTGNPNLANAVTAPNGNASGFYKGASTADADASLFSWGADVATNWSPPQRVLAKISLVQDFVKTEIVLKPLSGSFPENALLVVRLTSGIQDFGGLPLAPYSMSFTTQNLPMQTSSYTMKVEGETPFDSSNTTSDVNTARAPGVIQGYLLFAGDGDNGSIVAEPSGPKASPACASPLQANDGNKDDFNPAGDFLFDTGATANICANTVDGSTAVVWEFATFRIGNGVTVRVKGVNPAIFLVQGDVVIESGGKLMVRGDNIGGSPQGRGTTGYAWTSYSTTVVSGGVGVAGGGNGGASTKFLTGPAGEDGFSAFGSASGLGVKGGEGAGQGGTAHATTYPTSPGTAQGGGGGGHGAPGGDAPNVLGPSHTNKGPTKGKGGVVYPVANSMLTPSAGGGGGAGGNEEWDGNYQGIYSTGGGSGGAGGGFVDLTSSGNITIFGTIDAAGSAAGSGGTSNYYAGPGGGGGGAGGGVRLLTSASIILGPTTTITCAGGAGGNSPLGGNGAGGPVNLGQPGGHGRIVMEDSDSVIAGLGVATLSPSEGQNGFYRDIFDPSRFKGGGTQPWAQTLPFGVGPLNPDYLTPAEADFKAAIPPLASNGVGATSIFIEARGYQLLPSGLPDLGNPSPWRTVGFFRDSGSENQPQWMPNATPGDVTPPAGNAGGTIHNLDGYEFLQIRVTFYLPSTIGPLDGGPILDDWTIRFQHDQ